MERRSWNISGTGMTGTEKTPERTSGHGSSCADRGWKLTSSPSITYPEKRLTGLEALFRARDGEGGYLDPETLVMKAEEEGWVHRIDL